MKNCLWIALVSCFLMGFVGCGGDEGEVEASEEGVFIAVDFTSSF